MLILCCYRLSREDRGQPASPHRWPVMRGFCYILSLRRFNIVSPLMTVHVWKTNSLHWRHNERDRVSNHQPHDCLFNRLFGHRSKKTSKLPVTDLCEGNSPVTGEFSAQRVSNAEMFPFDDVIMWCKFWEGQKSCLFIASWFVWKISL